jgi:hypothetical protein
MEEAVVKWEAFVKEHNIKTDDLPDNVQHKIQNFEEAYSEYEEIEETDENESAIRNLELEIKAMDNGILNDLQSFHAQKKASAPKGDETPKAGDGGQTPPTPPTPPQHQASDKPSWAFWL